jgi:RNA polymerase sigma-70 factor (ECF subfamily)
MLLQDSRRLARSGPNGELVLLADQNRTKWDRGMIAEGLKLLGEVMAQGEIGIYTLQAAIAAEHARAKTPEDTDWRQIAAYYDLLLSAQPSPIAELNRAVAVAMRDGPEKGLDLVDAILQSGDLGSYHLAHSARADFLRRLGRKEEAVAAYEMALTLCRQAPEQAFLRKRISDLATTEGQ